LNQSTKISGFSTFIKEKYRVDLINKIPETKFILIKTKKLLEKNVWLKDMSILCKWNIPEKCV